MLRSMTGYGAVRLAGEGFELSVEVRGINNRFFKITSKISEEVSFLQSEMEEEVRRQVERGSINLVLRFQPTRFTDLYEIDEDVLRKYVGRIRKLRRTFGAGMDLQPRDFLLLPGVIRSEESVVLGKEVVLPVALRGLRRALAALHRMREREGRNLLKGFRGRARLLRRLLEKVAAEAPGALKDYQDRLQSRVDRLLADKELALSPHDLLKEIAILAERSDITEEIERLRSHFDQFDETLDAEIPVGRKLEFLIQEMLREANTMASKSISADLNRYLVEIKAEVDRFKEQIQNVE